MRLKLLTLALVFLLTACTANPLICFDQADRHVCLLKLDRSAKNYWEYWAVVAVDGVEQPRVRYDLRSDCRGDRLATDTALTVVQDWVCGQFKG